MAQGPEVTVRLPPGCPSEIDAEELRQRLLLAIEASGAEVARLHVEVVDDAAMDAYHRKHSGVAGTTDVLTFLASEPDEAIEVDIVACLDEATRRGAEFGHGPARELLLYGVHGLLHCMGHDDHDPAAFERMHAEEDRILRSIGIGATFRP